MQQPQLKTVPATTAVKRKPLDFIGAAFLQAIIVPDMESTALKHQRYSTNLYQYNLSKRIKQSEKAILQQATSLS